MAYEVDDAVQVTASVMRKNPITGQPESLNLTDEAGVVKKEQTYEDKPEKNQYHVETALGTFYLNESKLSDPPA